MSQPAASARNALAHEARPPRGERRAERARRRGGRDDDRAQLARVEELRLAVPAAGGGWRADAVYRVREVRVTKECWEEGEWERVRGAVLGVEVGEG